MYLDVLSAFLKDDRGQDLAECCLKAGSTASGATGDAGAGSH